MTSTTSGASDNQDEWLDPEEFPFSESELRAALKPWSHWPELADLADEIVEGLRSCCADRARAAAALARGSRDLEVINHATYVFPDEVWALVAELSPAHASRVEAFFEDRRAQRRAHRLATAMHQAGFSSRAAPTPEIIAAIQAEDEAADAQWIAFRARVRLETFGGADSGDARGVT